MKNIILITLLVLSSITLYAQREWNYTSSLTALGSSAETLPFWATTNKFGVVPNSRGGLMQAGIFSDFNTQKTLQLSYGASFAGYLTQLDNNVILDELYVSARWEKLRLDLGMIHPQEQFGGISAQNGNAIQSTNSRSMPGYNLHSEYIDIPFTESILAFKFNLSDYQMIDNRYVENTLMHHKSIYFKITPIEQLEFVGGFEHYAQWAGNSPVYGKQPSGLDDYWRIFLGSSGGSDATGNDQRNVLGNHLGKEHFEINYKSRQFKLSLYHDTIFEDGSGASFKNFPDGTWGIYYGSTSSQKSFITDATYEFFYSKNQSGSLHERPATPEEMAQQDPNSPTYGKIVLGGIDNYFNNGEYLSGWTYYGRVIGNPFITPTALTKDGISLGTNNNRVVAHYVGIKGYFYKKMPYKFRASYSINYGTYVTPLEDKPKQFSFGLEAGVVRSNKFPFLVDVGVYGDFGELFANNFGVTLTLTHRGTL